MSKKRSPVDDKKERKPTRRAILAALGIGAALPALRATAQPRDRKKDDADFAEHWKNVQKDIEVLRKEKRPREREILELRIHALRNRALMTLDRSDYAGCGTGEPKPTPTPYR